ncbi:esterase-like activity of phytase family protein [Jiella pacifica]|uniref:esterase-like activity of phytase family protein n=1 Tax=Jiella pacifica TaxID=2696469 RepID=UPI001FE2FA7E|nr:esterase-like activity of phytase family protein [Jiella pacifica]
MPGPSAFAAPIVAGAGEPITVRSSEIRRFDKNSDSARFGALTFLGGLQFSSSDGRLHGISAIRLMPGGERFVAVTDNGCWITGAIARDDDGRPTGLADVAATHLTDLAGRQIAGKALGDAESLVIDLDSRTAVVGFEQRHRIWTYDLDDLGTGSARNLPLPFPVGELRVNKGLETLAIAPKGSSLGGRMVTVAEHSIDEAGNLFAGIVGRDGGHGSVFKVRRDEAWEVSDGDFLANGDLLLLERRFQGIFSGLGIRIRQIPGASIRPGALVDGPVIFEADLSNEIDNMEGLDVWQDDAGRTRLTLVSDDNRSIFQRNIYLEFIWSGESDQPSGFTSSQ